MGRKILVSVVMSLSLAMILCGCLRNRASRRIITFVSLSHFEKEIFDLINKHRLKNSLNPLTFNMTLLAAAKEHTTEMSSGLIDFGHVKFAERSQSLIKRLDVQSVGENVAKGQESAEQLVEEWLKSEEHLKNIEGHFDLSAVSAVRSSAGQWYFTQLFARK